MKNLTRTFILTAAVGLLTACASVGVGFSVPVGPFGSVSIGTSSSGGVSVGAGVGGAHGSVGIGGTIPTEPWGGKKTDKENLPAPTPLAPASAPQ